MRLSIHCILRPVLYILNRYECYSDSTVYIYPYSTQIDPTDQLRINNPETCTVTSSPPPPMTCIASAEHSRRPSLPPPPHRSIFHRFPPCSHSHRTIPPTRERVKLQHGRHLPHSPAVCFSARRAVSSLRAGRFPWDWIIRPGQVSLSVYCTTA
ncbi:hypothetical protein BP00DRAFT_239649 [Aspergillus indologenus CBS 114.80]|uniref:Uncharacterized protein n=1 Tax=Aspergillus indologenus CBS 114.80 TaxID=1450541 RepID=A0A2V5HZR3_9EURO|nr:hypothetical protein BP00DRAFT_239649 [Aspergillus indologenus CBS 114.80]